MASYSFTNLVPNGSFESDATGWVAGSNNNAINLSIARQTPIIAPGHGEYGSASGYCNGQINFSAQSGVNKAASQTSNITVVSGRKYYIRAQCRVNISASGFTGDSFQFSNAGVDIGHSFTIVGANVFGLVDFIWTANTTTLGLRLQAAVQGLSGNTAAQWWIDNVVVMDLTTPFGAGNEPPLAAARQAVLDYAGPNGGKGFFSGTATLTFPDPPVIDTTVTTFAGVYSRVFSNQVLLIPNTGTGPFSFNISGLSDGHGLSIDNYGNISGILGLFEGSYNFDIAVTDAVGFQDTASYTLNVGEPPRIIDTFIPSGVYEEPYSFTFDVQGSTPLTVSIVVSSGTLPTGLSINPSTWTISGTPTVDGQSCRITVIAYNVYDNTGNVTRTFDFAVRSSAHINTTSPLRSGIAGQAYAPLQFNATGLEPITWELLSLLTDLPPGLWFDEETGILSGTPTMAGTYAFSLRAENAIGHDDAIFEITINTLPQITTTTLGYARLLTPYSAQLTATGTTPITWSVISGQLPVGLSLNSATGTITGQVQNAGTATFTVEARNIAGTVTRQLSIQSGTALAIMTTSPLRVGTVGQAYGNLTFVAEGIDSFYTISWTNPGGNIPAGMTFTTAGVLSGTPSTAGTYTFNIRITNGTSTAESPFTLVVGAVPQIMTGTSLVGGADRPFTMTLAATSTAAVMWAITAGPTPSGGGSMPQGSQLILSPTGVLSWLVPVTGSYVFTVVATNQFGNSIPVTFTLTITTPSISDVFPPDNTQVLAPEIYLIVGTKSSSLKPNFLPYTFTANGDPPLTWTLQLPTGGTASGETAGIPAGLTFDEPTGSLDGVPTTIGRYKFDLRVSNIPANAHAQETFWINVVARPVILTPSLLSGVEGESYPPQAQSLQASGTPPITWTILPPVGSETGLPPGLSLNGSNITGTPAPGTAFEEYTFTVQAQNISGLGYVDTRQYTILIAGFSGAPVIITPATLTAIRGQPYSQTISVLGDPLGSLQIMDGYGTLPTGINFSSSQLVGTLSGTPTVAGVFELAFQAFNGYGFDERIITLIVLDPPIITTNALPDATANEPYYYQLTATGDAPLSWTVTGLPAGLSANASGEISGTPEVFGNHNITIRVSNDAGSVQTVLALHINAPLRIIKLFLNGKRVGALFYGGKKLSQAFVSGRLIFG